MLSIALCMVSERISEVEYRFGEIIQNAGYIVRKNTKRMTRNIKRSFGCGSVVESVLGLNVAMDSNF